MSFPIVASAASTIATNPPTTTIAVNMPATVTAGQRLVCFASAYRPTGANTITPPAGWTTANQSSNTPANGAIFHKVAAGTEGGTTENFTLSNNWTTVFYVIAVSNQNGLEVNASASGLNANSNSGSLTPSWGAEDTLWISFSAYADDDGTVSTYPSGYTGGVNVIGGGGVNNSACIGLAFKEANAASEDPGIMLLSETERWIAWTVAIRTNNESGGGFKPAWARGSNQILGVIQ